MRLLAEVEPETRVVVKKIEGGSEIKAYLGDLGIAEEVEVTLLAVEPVHAHVGPISLKVHDKEVIVSQGWADKILVEKEGALLPLLGWRKAIGASSKPLKVEKTSSPGFPNWASMRAVKWSSCAMSLMRPCSSR